MRQRTDREIHSSKPAPRKVKIEEKKIHILRTKPNKREMPLMRKRNMKAKRTQSGNPYNTHQAKQSPPTTTHPPTKKNFQFYKKKHPKGAKRHPEDAYTRAKQKRGIGTIAMLIYAKNKGRGVNSENPALFN